MIGKLDPEENVMDECVSGSSWISDLHKALDALQWKHGEKIAVEIGGTQVSGIHQGEDYNKKWAAPYGTRKYNKDAFIVIKNLDRNPTISSQPFPEGEFKPHHGTDSTK
jgi:hypothetical protein